MKELVKIVVTVPPENGGALRKAIGDAGAGAIGNYSYCSYTIRGVGRFLPNEGANPTVGEVGKPEEVEEERIEVTCEKDSMTSVVQAIRQVHPYEVPVIDIYPMLLAVEE